MENLQSLALAESGGSKGKEAPNEGPPPQRVETFECLARVKERAKPLSYYARYHEEPVIRYVMAETP